MTPAQYAKAIADLGMSQVGAARFLKIGERTSRRFIAGESKIPVVAEMLLNIMVAHGISPEIARAKYTRNGIVAAKPKAKRKR